jgi:hypothetical protein
MDSLLSQRTHSLTTDDDSSSKVNEIPTRSTANPSRLNPEWRAFFRDSLVAADPIMQQAEPTFMGGTPAPLPPPIRAAPNEPSGDPFSPKSRNSFRIWSVNANGISSKNDFAELHALCVALKSHSVDAMALQEPNTDFMNKQLRDTYTDIFKEHFGQARVLMATTCIEAPRAWKPGGGGAGHPGHMGPTCDQGTFRRSREMGIRHPHRLRRRQLHHRQPIQCRRHLFERRRTLDGICTTISTFAQRRRDIPCPTPTMYR